MSALISAIIGAIVGSLAAFVLAWFLETNKKKERKKNVAIAVVYELRMFKRTIEDNLKAAEKKYVIFNVGLSDIFFKNILTELPDFGPKIFLYVKSTNSQIRQINYLRNKFENVLKPNKYNIHSSNLGEAYTASLKEALENINAALNEMIHIVEEKHFKNKLPDLKHLTEIEEKLMDKY